MQLLNRTTRHASPTENGQRYFERAVVILSEIEAADQAVTQAQSAPRGLLRVNAPMSFGTMRLGPVLADFMARYPELQLQIVLSDDLLDPVQDGFDVTLRIAELEIFQPDRAEDRAGGAHDLRLAGLSGASRHAKASAGSARACFADLRLPAHRQSVEAHRH